jgi:hypothetical protein
LNALVRLFGELVRRRVISYQTYTRVLISRGLAPQLPNTDARRRNADQAQWQPVTTATMAVATAADDD